MEKSEIQSYIDGFKSILKKRLPEFNTLVGFNGVFIYVSMSISEHEINSVRGQYVQHCMLGLYIRDMKLDIHYSCGSGGRSIDIKPEEGQNLYCQSVKIPFRRPKPTQEAIFKAVDKFCQNYKQTLIDNYDNLMYKHLVDYSFILEE